MPDDLSGSFFGVGKNSAGQISLGFTLRYTRRDDVRVYRVFQAEGVD